MSFWLAMAAPGDGCDRDTMKANSLPVILSPAAAGREPRSRTKKEHDRFRDARTHRVEKVHGSLSNPRAMGVLRRLRGSG
jgi:hypothetical protein